MSNREEIVALNKIAIIQELIEKTKNCVVIWKQKQIKQYDSNFNGYKFIITQPNPNSVVLDVLKNNNLYKSYNSLSLQNLKELFNTIEIISIGADLEKYKKINEFLYKKGSCRQEQIGSLVNIYDNFVFGFGAEVGGSAPVEKFRNEEIFLLPNNITFDPNLTFLWSGNHTDIDDEPDVELHDGDLTFIRQQISGVSPRLWGYANIKFDTISLPILPPYGAFIRIVSRREEESNVFLNVEVVSNNTVFFNTQVEQFNYYSFWSQYVSLGNTSINDLTVRLSMFTNSSNLLPRAIRITAVDLRLFGKSIA